MAMEAPTPLNIEALCAQTPLFKNASSEWMERIMQQAVVRHERKGRVLFIQGDEAESFYLIVRGWVKLFRETLEGCEAVIDVRTKGHLFGDSCVFEDGFHGYSAQVVEDTTMIALPVYLLRQAIESDQQIALNMLAGMSQHRRQQRQEIEHLNVQNAPQRIGCFLLRLCPADASSEVKLNLPYDKTLIAARLGMKAETFSRALNKLKNETDIAINGPTVMIHDMKKLVTYTCNHCSSNFPCEDKK